MVALAMVGILASLAVQKVSVFLIKAKQAEAKANLRQIYGLQESFIGEHGVYSKVNTFPVALRSQLLTQWYNDPAAWAPNANCNASNALGFSITDCNKVRYAYAVANTGTDFDFEVFAREVGGGPARRVNTGCPWTWEPDEWNIDQNGSIQMVRDTSGPCP